MSELTRRGFMTFGAKMGLTAGLVAIAGTPLIVSAQNLMKMPTREGIVASTNFWGSVFCQETGQLVDVRYRGEPNVMYEGSEVVKHVTPNQVIAVTNIRPKNGESPTGYTVRIPSAPFMNLQYTT